LNARRRAEFYLLSITVVWGSTFVITKSLLEENSPLFYTAIRFLLGSLLLIALFPRRLTRISRSTLMRGSLLGLLLYAGFVVQTVGMQYTTASKSAFFTGMLTVLTPLVQIAVQRFYPAGRKQLKIGNLLGVVAAGAGLYLLTSPAGSRFNKGDALTLVCALFFACYIVYLDLVSDEPDKLRLSFVQFLFCAVVGMPVALLFEQVRAASSGAYILSLLYLTIVATVIAMWVQNRYQGDTSPTRAAVIFAVEPVVAAVFAYFVRGELIGLAGILGGAMIVGGLLISEFSDALPVLSRAIAAPAGASAGAGGTPADAEKH
jgi:drug/metabolite transporter (DMT)-like permease